MLMAADMGEGGVKNLQKSADVLYGRSPRDIIIIVVVNECLNVS